MSSVLLALTLFATVVKADDALVKAAPAAFPYELWDELLHRYVDEAGRVDYARLRSTAADAHKLDQLFAAVAATGPASHPELFKTRQQKLAYYLDAYNVLVWKNVLQRLPRLRNLDRDKAEIFFFTRFVVDGKELNLKELEGDLVRPFKDPRVHMALNCGAAGGPLLPQYAFVPDKLEEQLTAEVRKFVAEKRNVELDPTGKVLRLSPIFDWYKDELGKNPRKIIEWINGFRAPEARLPAGVKLQYPAYDWTLNDVSLHER